MTEHPITEPHVKLRIYEKQGGRCAYCGQKRKLKTMTVDHIIPLSKGGTDEESNLRCACKMCNYFKGSALPLEFSNRIHTIFMNNLEFCEMELKGGGYVAN